MLTALQQGAGCAAEVCGGDGRALPAGDARRAAVPPGRCVPSAGDWRQPVDGNTGAGSGPATGFLRLSARGGPKRPSPLPRRPNRTPRTGPPSARLLEQDTFDADLRTAQQQLDQAERPDRAATDQGTDHDPWNLELQAVESLLDNLSPPPEASRSPTSEQQSRRPGRRSTAPGELSRRAAIEHVIPSPRRPTVGGSSDHSPFSETDPLCRLPLRKFQIATVVLAGSAGWVWSQDLTPPIAGARHSDTGSGRASRPPVAVPPSVDLIRANPLPVSEPYAQVNPATEAGVRNEFQVAPQQDHLIFNAKVSQPVYRVIPKTRTVVEYITVQVSDDERAEGVELNTVIETLKSSGSQEEKDAAAKTLADLLAKQFNRDLERREKEVAELEERVKKLREQVTKRKGAKDDIIKLRLTTITNEAAGLGFPATGERGPREFGGDVQYFNTAPAYGVPSVTPVPAPGPTYTPLSR